MYADILSESLIEEVETLQWYTAQNLLFIFEIYYEGWAQS